MGPLGNGPTWKINDLGALGTLPNPGDLLEVLAGAISWGFKSPSSHHILEGLAFWVDPI